MIESSVLQWLLTALFTATGAWFFFAGVRAGTRIPSRVSGLCHGLMSLAMVAMIWPWGMDVAPTSQIVLFAFACLWFLACAVAGPRWGGDGHHVSRRANTHHAIMMAGMAWMVGTMPTLMSGHTPDSGGGHHHAAAAGAPAVGTAMAVPVVITAATVVLALFFVVSCLPWIADALDHGRRLPPGAPRAQRATVADCACHGLMSLGMGVMLLAVL